MTNCRDDKVCSADQAVAAIPDHATLAVGGFVGAAHPEELTAALEKRFLETGGPEGLTLVYAAGQGDGKTRGLNHLAHAGLVRRVIGGHWGLCPGLGKLALAGQIEAYNFPQGVICQLFRDIAAGRPGCITHVGLETFIDPIHSGGRLNERTPPGMIERVELDGQIWLWYKAFPIHVGLIRATRADRFGNLFMDQEAIIGEVLPIAQAAKNSGGMVIAQVAGVTDEPMNPQHVRVPGILVDRIVVAQAENHQQTFAECYNSDYCTQGSRDCPWTNPPTGLLDNVARRIIAARACDELQVGDVANLGIGMPEGIAQIASERGLLEQLTLTVESGPIGGMPVGGLSFGASRHPQAIIDQPAQFDFYDGRGLDFAALGAAQIDARGNVNVSRFGTRFAGVGGFVNITQSARKLVFCGTFTASGLETEIRDGKLRILREGTALKFLNAVEQISFSSARSRQIGQQVHFVTERAVFQLRDEGLELIEVAPGIDIHQQILDKMEFQPIIRDIRPMRPGLFQ